MKVSGARAVVVGTRGHSSEAEAHLWCWPWHPMHRYVAVRFGPLDISIRREGNDTGYCIVGSSGA